MTRFVLPLIALSAITMGCNAADAKERDTVWTSMEALDDSGQLHGRAIRVRASVDAQARDMETELEVDASTTRTGEEQPRVDMYVITNAADLMGILEGTAPPDARASDGGATVALNPNFSSCDGEGYTQTSSGGCDFSSTLLILGDGPRTLVVGGAVKVWAPDDWSGDPDSINVTMDIEAVDVESE